MASIGVQKNGKFQVVSIDEYNQQSIVDTASSVREAVKKAKKIVSDLNFDNPLTLAEKMGNCESCFIELFDPEDDEAVDCESAVYSGKDSKGKDIVYLVDEDKTSNISETTAEIRAYIGSVDNKATVKVFYAEDDRKRPVSKLSHRFFQGKTRYFVRKVK